MEPQTQAERLIAYLRFEIDQKDRERLQIESEIAALRRTLSIVQDMADEDAKKAAQAKER